MLHHATPATPQVAAESPPELIEAGQVKAELNRKIRQLYDDEGRVRTRRAFDALRRDRERFALASYLPAITALRGLGPTTLRELRATLLARLERGWAMAGLDEHGHRLFGELLCQYEALCDALSTDAVSPTLRRLETIGRAVP